MLNNIEMPIIEPLVSDILDKKYVEEMKNDYEVSVLKGKFTTWEDEVHDGYFVKEVGKDQTYFMEVTYKKIAEKGKYVYCEKVFHKLLPFNFVPMQQIKNVSSMEDIVHNIIAGVSNSEHFDFDKVNGKYVMVGNPYETIAFLNSKEKIIRYENKRNEVFNALVEGKCPPEHEYWYLINYGSMSDIENDVIKALRKNGNIVRIVGERDSFGWVTRGIEVNGTLMCLV